MVDQGNEVCARAHKAVLVSSGFHLPRKIITFSIFKKIKYPKCLAILLFVQYYLKCFFIFSQYLSPLLGVHRGERKCLWGFHKLLPPPDPSPMIVHASDNVLFHPEPWSPRTLSIQRRSYSLFLRVQIQSIHVCIPIPFGPKPYHLLGLFSICFL